MNINMYNAEFAINKIKKSNERDENGYINERFP